MATRVTYHSHKRVTCHTKRDGQMVTCYTSMSPTLGALRTQELAALIADPAEFVPEWNSTK